MRLIAILTAVCGLTACMTNPYREFYVERIASALEAPSNTKLAEIPAPQVKHGLNADDDTKALVDAGYELVGASSFRAADIGDWQAAAQAKRVGATLVLIFKQYEGTMTGALPMTTPTTTTSTTSFNGNVTGQYGQQLGGFRGNSYTTNYGTQTMFVPYAVDRFSYTASFWRKPSPARESAAAD